MDQILVENSEIRHPFQHIQFSTIHVYNMDTGSVEARQVLGYSDVNREMARQSSGGGGGVTTGGERASGNPNGEGCFEVTIDAGIRPNSSPGRDQLCSSPKFTHHGVADNAQVENSQNNTSSAKKSSEQTTSMNVPLSIASTDNERADDREVCGNTNSSRLFPTSIGTYSYTNAIKPAQCQETTVYYDVNEDNTCDPSTIAEQNNISQANIHSTGLVLETNFETLERNERGMIVQNGQSDEIMTPVLQNINQPTLLTCPQQAGFLGGYAVLVEVPQGEICPVNGEIFYVDVGGNSTALSLNNEQQMFQPVRDETVLEKINTPLADGARIASGTWTDESAVSSAESAPSETDQAAEDLHDDIHDIDDPIKLILASKASTNKCSTNNEHDEQMSNSTKDVKSAFQDPPKISRKIRIFGANINEDGSNISGFHSDNNFAFSINETSLPTKTETGTSNSRNDCLTSRDAVAASSVLSMINSAQSSNLSFQGGEYPRTRMLPNSDVKNTRMIETNHPVKPIPLPISLSTSQMGMYGMPGVPAAVTHPLSHHPMAPIPLPPLAVFANPIQLLPAALQWSLHGQLQASAPGAVPGQVSQHCLHRHAATAALNSTARLSANHPILRRGRRARRPMFPRSSPVKEELESDHLDDSSSASDSKRTEANARERDRVTHLNYGFDQLRKVLPWSHRGGRRVSKVDTLRAAISYISFLQNILVAPDVSTSNSGRRSNGAVFGGDVKPSYHLAAHGVPYPVLPPGCRFAHPPPLPSAALHHRANLPPRSALPPFMQLPGLTHPGLNHMIPMKIFHPSQTNQSTALSWLISVQDPMRPTFAEHSTEDLPTRRSPTDESTNGEVEEHHVTQMAPHVSRCPIK